MLLKFKSNPFEVLPELPHWVDKERNARRGKAMKKEEEEVEEVNGTDGENDDPPESQYKI